MRPPGSERGHGRDMALALARPWRLIRDPAPGRALPLPRTHPPRRPGVCHSCRVSSVAHALEQAGICRPPDPHLSVPGGAPRSMGPSGADREETYWQRVGRIRSMMDLSTAIVTPSELEQDLDAIRRSEAGEEVDGVRLERAHKHRDSIVHPDTGKAIVAPLRLSMIVPMNCMLDVLMISARSFGATVAAQWANQTYNALHYYANRNASNAEPTSQRVGAYIGATASSVGTALGLRHWASHLASVRPRRAATIRRMAPFCAVAAADLLNLGITRKNEYLDGITVRRRNGEEVGRSRVAGAFSVATCVFGRVGAAAPVLLVSPLIMARLEHRPWLASRPWLRMPLMVGIVGCMITTAVPLVFGVFKQTAGLPATALEPEFRHLTEDDGTTPAELMFNKGL